MIRLQKAETIYCSDRLRSDCRFLVKAVETIVFGGGIQRSGNFSTKNPKLDRQT